MQALMLAAGIGSRLGKYTEESPKCMVEVGGKALIVHVFESLKEAGIKRFIIVTGYCAEKLEDFVRKNIKNMEIVFIRNNAFQETNNIYSLYLAREYLMADDTILLESDLIFERDLIKNVVDYNFPNVAVIAPYEHWMDGAAVTLDEYNQIRAFYIQGLDDLIFNKAAAIYKTVNIYKLSKEFSQDVYLPFLEVCMNVCGKDQYYEIALKAICHLMRNLVLGYILQCKWYEIDSIKDLEIAKNIFTS